MTISRGIEHAFDIGADVEVLADRRTNTTWRDGAWHRDVVDVWQRAHVYRLEPYLGRPGYYVNYPDAKEMYECHGGWVQEHRVRARVA